LRHSHKPKRDSVKRVRQRHRQYVIWTVHACDPQKLDHASTATNE
jgi:hypothetical protein